MFLKVFNENELTKDVFFQTAFESNVPIIDNFEINQWAISNHTIKSIFNVNLKKLKYFGHFNF
jgi:hypothetical protein